MVSKVFKLGSIFFIFIMLTQFSAQQTSITGGEKPMINFYGTVIDKSGKEYKAENITISGAYAQIIMYQQPPRSDMTPSHRVKIDLAEESEINVIYVGDKPDVKKFKNREYLVLELISHDKTKNSYIIEKNRKLYFDVPSPIGPKEHEVSLVEIEKVIIDGYKERVIKKKQKK